MCNVENNANSEKNFLLNVDFFNIFLHATIYFKVFLDMILKTANLGKKIQKQVLTKQIDIVEIKFNNVNTRSLV